MDKSEAIVKAHLEYLGFAEIVYQPDGKHLPPDFLVGDRIAVEVRRLNENEVNDVGELQGLETIRISTERKLMRLCKSLGPSKSGSSWFIELTLKRPIPAWRDMEPDLRRKLVSFRDDEQGQRPCTINIAHGVKVRVFFKASVPHPTCFILGACNDADRGGFAFENTQRNLRLCVREKMEKIARVRHKYPEWWLIFVDLIGFGVDECDRDFFRDHLKIEHDLDRVILVNPLDPTQGFEVPRKLVLSQITSVERKE
jgi:hypothetical protein